MRKFYPTMNHASLFTGIGGFDFAADLIGWTNIFQVEKDEFCQSVLEKRFPETDKHHDINEFDATKYRGKVDILTGGFPCQPFSTAGKRMGKDDDRHLWPEMLRIIREVQPLVIVGENVAGLVSMEDGNTIESIFSDLESEGFEVQPFVIPACAVQAIHRRDRIWIVAYSSSKRRIQLNQGGTALQDQHRNSSNQEQRRNKLKIGTGRGNEYDATNANSIRLERGIESRIKTTGQKKEARQDNSFKRPGIQWNPFELLRPTVSPVRRADDGLPPELDRRKRLKALGNAIVPQVAFEIFKAIEQDLLNP